MNDDTDDDTRPSTPLDRLLTDAGVTDARFTRLLNDLARRRRHGDAAVVRTTVAHWRRGTHTPRDPAVADLAAAAVSDLAGYTVSAADLGWRGEAPDDLGLVPAGDPAQAAATVGGLAGRDTGRVPARPPFVAGAFEGPALLSLARALGARRGHAGPPPGAGTALVAAMTATLRALDARYGAAAVRPQAAVLLHEAAASARRGGCDRGELAALADLAQFCGWLAQDCGRHGTAQRYYIQALGLAEHAGEHMLAARTLSAMAGQAAELGDHRLCLALSWASVQRAQPHPHPLVAAMLHDRRARALAAAGDAAGCERELAAVGAALAAADAGGGEPPGWAAHYNAADAAECGGRCNRLLGRREAAVAALLEARAQDPGRVRARALAEACLALAHLGGDAPDLDAALDAADRAVDLAALLDSARVTRKLRTLYDAVAPHTTVAARQWRESAAGYLRDRAAAGRAGGKPAP